MGGRDVAHGDREFDAWLETARGDFADLGTAPGIGIELCMAAHRCLDFRLQADATAGSAGFQFLEDAGRTGEAAGTSLHQSREIYSLYKCVAWVTVAFARIAAATMAASVSILSFAPALRASFICNSMQ